jgi:hypothetical protein
MKYSILILLLLPGCTPERPINKTPDPQLDHFLSEIASKEQIGRFQIIPFNDGQRHTLVRLDTITGKAWFWEHVLVNNTNFNTAVRADGWSIIPDDFEVDIAKQMHLNPKATP